MKLLLALLGTALLSMNAYASPPRANCVCGENCDCVPENHCGCLSKKGNDYQLANQGTKECQCQKGCGCGKGNKTKD